VPDNNLPQKGDVVAAKYQVERTLGSGGMGAVYQVTHRVTGKAFAIKWLLPKLSAQTDAVQRFIREAQVAGRVDHPNIVEVYDVGQEDETFFMVMELLHGESLAQRLTSRGRLTPAEICQILIPVTHGLDAAHRAGVIHRDLKPDNIFLSRESGSSRSTTS
jgi:serine/threonine-protein kinase